MDRNLFALSDTFQWDFVRDSNIRIQNTTNENIFYQMLKSVIDWLHNSSSE